MATPDLRRRQPRNSNVLTVLRAPALAVVALAAMASGCSTKSAEPTSQSSSGSGSTSATAATSLMVDGHTHTIGGAVECKPETANPSGTPPCGDTQISAGDNTASFTVSWLSNATPPLKGMTFTLKVENGEYSTPWVPNPSVDEATNQDKGYAVRGTASVRPPGKSDMTMLPFEIHVTCP